MNMKAEAIKIYQEHITNEEKIRLLRELILDCDNQLVAQSENMHPEVKNSSEEGLRMATNYLRQLESEV